MTFRLKVLYDDLLTKEVAKRDKNGNVIGHGVKCSTLHGLQGIPVLGTRKLLWSDLQDLALDLPVGVSPYRTCLTWIARRAFEKAQSSERPHSIADANMPSDVEWNDIMNHFCQSGSPSTSFVMQRFLSSV